MAIICAVVQSESHERQPFDPRYLSFPILCEHLSANVQLSPTIREQNSASILCMKMKNETTHAFESSISYWSPSFFRSTMCFQLGELHHRWCWEEPRWGEYAGQEHDTGWKKATEILREIYRSRPRGITALVEPSRPALGARHSRRPPTVAINWYYPFIFTMSELNNPQDDADRVR